MKVNGSYIENGKMKKGEVLFWGEFEAPSKIILKNNPKKLPRYIFEPEFNKCNSIPENIKNTDPFFFGEEFYYCICRQDRNISLKNLNKFSLILFGSTKKNKKLDKYNFHLDSLFVVNNKYEYSINNYSSLKKNSIKNIISYNLNILPIYKSTVKTYEEYSLYSGVMYKNNKDIFSFSPCKLFNRNQHESNFFERPILKIKGITSNLSQNIKEIEKFDSIDEVKARFNEIRQNIENEGYSLMVQNEL
jgi:hypothetical protein